MQIRGQDVLLPTTIVNSLPRPIFMEGRVFHEGVRARDYPSFRVRELYHHAVAIAVKDQQDAGLDVTVDGGQYYENETNYELAEHHHIIAQRLEGYAPYGGRMVAGTFDLPIYKPTAHAPIVWRRPIMAPVAEAVRTATAKPFKLHLGIGPVTLAAITTDEYYGGDIKALAMDVGKAFNAELRNLQERGDIDMVQVAEPLTFFENEPWIIEALNAAFEGITMTKVVHVCYGHEEGQAGQLELRANKFLPWALDIDCDVLHVETASHDFAEVAAFKNWPADKGIAVGVLDGKNLNVESPEKIAGWLRKLIEVVPPEQVMVATDCALASLRQIVAQKKMAALVAGTQIVRDQLTGTATG
jgi:5-methyltetrahydropteroyltriglutamate--homocysteine methyltransferase